MYNYMYYCICYKFGMIPLLFEFCGGVVVVLLYVVSITMHCSHIDVVMCREEVK